MDAGQALADLVEISSQIQAAVLLDAAGNVLASTFASEGQAERVARAALELLEAAEQVRSEDEKALAQLEAATLEGSIFVVRDGERIVAATTGPEPTVGLVFYDLKSCLRAAGGEEAPKPQPRRQPRQQAEGEPEGDGAPS